MSDSSPTRPRVLFAPGALAKLPAELTALGHFRPFVVTTAGRKNLLPGVKLLLGDSLAGVFDGAVEHAPVEVTRYAEAQLRMSDADVIVAVGGGSPIGLGKALVLNTGLPLAVIPTTYSGSEMTSIYGVTDTGGKRTGRDSRVLPGLVLYDPELTFDLPAEVTAASGMNALAHSVESMYAPNATDQSTSWAEESITRLVEDLPVAVQEPRNLGARSRVLFGAHLAGMALNATVMGLHHRICHVLGGMFRLPHSRTHAVILPYVTAFNSTAALLAMSRISSAMGAISAVEGLVDLSSRLPLPRTLRQLGFQESDIPRAAMEIANGNYPNPRPAPVSEVANILTRAFRGDSPSSLYR